MYGDFPAKNTGYTPYIPKNVCFWPTLDIHKKTARWGPLLFEKTTQVWEVTPHNEQGEGTTYFKWICVLMILDRMSKAICQSQGKVECVTAETWSGLM
jgi:hypothetical protein